MLKYLLFSVINIQLFAFTISEPISLSQQNISQFHLAANDQGDVALVYAETKKNDNRSDLYAMRRCNQGAWEVPQHFTQSQREVEQIKCAIDSAGCIRVNWEVEGAGNMVAWENSPTHWRFLENFQSLFHLKPTELKTCLTLKNELIFLAQSQSWNRSQLFTEFNGLTCNLNGQCDKPQTFYQETKKNIKDDLSLAQLSLRRIAIAANSEGGAFLAWPESLNEHTPPFLKLCGAYWNGLSWERETIASISDRCLPQFQICLGPKQQRAFFWFGKEGIQALTQMGDKTTQQATIGQLHVFHGVLSYGAFDKAGNLLMLWDTLDEKGRDVLQAAYKPYNQPWQSSADLKVFPDGIYCEDLQVQVDSKGNFFLVWNEDDNGDYSVHAGIYSAQKNALISESLVSPRNQNCYDPIFCFTEPETGIIAWKQKGMLQVVDISLRGQNDILQK